MPVTSFHGISGDNAACRFSEDQKVVCDRILPQRGSHEIFTGTIRSPEDFFNCFQHMADSLAVACHRATMSF